MFVPMCSPAILLDRKHLCRLCASALEALFNDTSDCKYPVSVGMAVRSRGRGFGLDPFLPSRAICSLVRIIWYSDDMLVDSGGLVVHAF
jgi:hypothetical protein